MQRTAIGQTPKKKRLVTRRTNEKFVCHRQQGTGGKYVRINKHRLENNILVSTARKYADTVKSSTGVKCQYQLGTDENTACQQQICYW
jgi:hypothetical protein